MLFPRSEEQPISVLSLYNQQRPSGGLSSDSWPTRTSTPVLGSGCEPSPRAKETLAGLTVGSGGSCGSTKHMSSHAYHLHLSLGSGRGNSLPTGSPPWSLSSIYFVQRSERRAALPAGFEAAPLMTVCLTDIFVHQHINMWFKEKKIYLTTGGRHFVIV